MLESKAFCPNCLKLFLISLIRNKGYISKSNLPDEREREELLQHKDKLLVGANFSVVKGSLDLNFSLSKL